MSVEERLNWPARFFDTARSLGYDFEPGRIGKALSWCVKQFGEEPVHEAWKVWMDLGPDLGEKAAFMTPEAFGRKVGYWLKQSKGVA